MNPQRAVPLWRRALPIVLWVAALVFAALRIAHLLQTAIVPGVPWQNPQHNLVDYRDLIVVPGQWIFAGGNPYDPAPYLAAHPWVQEFDPYAPAWLLLAVAMAWLPYLLGAAIHQVLFTAVTAVFLWILCRWALPRWADVAVPVGLLWLQVWYFSSAGIENGGTVLGCLGAMLVVRAICRRLPSVTGTQADPSVDIGCAIGIGLALIKPQFGIPLVVFALAAGRWRETVRGIIGVALASIPIVVALSISSGGFFAFFQSVLRNVAYANSPNATTGLFLAQSRVDLVGLVARHGLEAYAGLLTLGAFLVFLALTVVVIRRSDDPLFVSAAICLAVVLSIVHFPYDLMILVVPVVVGLGRVLDGVALGWTGWFVLAACTFVFFHLDGAAAFLFQKTELRNGGVDVFAMVAGFIVAVAAGIGLLRRLHLLEVSEGA
jgi:hypothetical protein